MGGNQSASSEQFCYECNVYVAKYISDNLEHRSELERIIGSNANLEYINSNGLTGQIVLKSKVNAAVTVVDDCKKKLDEFFNGYMSFEETLTKILSRSILDNVLSLKGLKCSTTENPLQNTIRITGISNDVKTMIKLLRDAQDPHPVDKASSCNSATQSSVQSSSSSLDTKHFDKTHSSSFVSKSNNSKIITSFEDFALDSSSDDESSINILSRQTVPVPLPRSNVQSCYSNEAEVQMPFFNDTSNKHQDDKKKKSSSFSQPDEYLSTYIVVSHTAPDFSVARFIKHSSVHTKNLQDAFSTLANITIWQVKGEKKLEYRFRPLQGMWMTKEEFESRCTDILTTFLNQYSSCKKYFNSAHLEKAQAKDPNFFQSSSSKSSELYVQWHIDSNLLFLAGVKTEVENKKKEVAQYLNALVPRCISENTMCKIPVTDYSVAQFLRNSPLHFSKLEECLKEIATIKICNVYNRHKNENSRKQLEYQCKPLQGVELSYDDFKIHCKKVLENFLKDFSSSKKFFNHDHLMKVALKYENYFKPQTPQEKETLYVEWSLDKNKVFVVGLKSDVVKKLEEITRFLDTAVPKAVKEHNFEMDPPDKLIAKFIKRSENHMQSLRKMVENAKVWITPGNYSIHFKALIELPQQDLPKFEEKCKSSVKDFFWRFGSWVQTYSIVVIEATKQAYPDLFVSQNTDWSLEISDQGEVTLVAPNSIFLQKKKEIIDIFEYSHERNGKNFRRSRNLADLSQQNLEPLPQYIYEPKKKANQTILKHIFQSPRDIAELEHAVGMLVRFEVFPDPTNPHGLRFFPCEGVTIDHHYYKNIMPSNIVKFLEKFLVFRRKCTPQDEQIVFNTVNQIGMRFQVPERMVSFHKENDFLHVAGRKREIYELKKVVKGNICDGEKVDVRMVPVHNRSRYPSSSSTPDKNPYSRPKKGKPTFKEAGQNLKKKEKVCQSINYGPKKQYVPMLEFAWENERFRKKLEASCGDLCILSGTAKNLKVTSLNSEVDDPQFSKKVIQMMESFLTSIQIEHVSLERNIIKYFKENEEKWLKTNFNPDDWVVINWHESGVDIKGFTDDVAKYKSVLEEQLEDTTTTTKIDAVMGRVLTICGVIAETNRQLSGNSKVTCSIEDGTISFSGKACFIDEAKSKLAEVGHLVEEEPKLSAQKLTVLKTILSNDEAFLDEIDKKFLEKNIKCVLLLPSDQVTLTAMTREMFNKGSKLLDSLIQTVEIALPEMLSNDVFSDPSWKNFSKKLTPLTNQFVFNVEDRSAFLTGLESVAMSQAVNDVKQFFKTLMTHTREVKCKPHVSKFILKFHPSSTLQVSETENGLSICGPCYEVDKFIETLREIKWSRSRPVYSAPNLSSHFSSSSWTDLVKILEHDFRCTITVDEVKGQKPEEQETISSPSSQNFDSNRQNIKEASYGKISVSVCHGDITADNSDIIINGVISRDFDLSRGTVSRALLQRAGRQMQEECNKADKPSPVMCHTRGWNLLCDYVIHIVTPNSADELAKRLKEALDHAELLRAKSVAVPTLGAGGIGLHAVEVAAAMSKAIEAFALEKNRYVKEVKVVVYEKSLVSLFEKSVVHGKEIFEMGKSAVELAESKAKSSLVLDEVFVFINTDDSSNLKKIKEKIDQHISNVIITKKIMNETVSELDDHDFCDLYEAAISCKASVTVSSITSEIILRGLNDCVTDLYDKVREIIFQLTHAMSMAKMFVWKWSSSSGIYKSLPLRVSLALEHEYEKNKSGSHQVMLYGSPFVVDFTSMTYNFKSVSGKVKREGSENIPSNWSDMLGKPWLKVSLDKNSAEYNRVFQLFKASNPSYQMVVDIERIQNPTLYKQYVIFKNLVERHMIQNEPAERELFHGTSQDTSQQICADGFNRSYAGKNATVYGKGCYFATQSSYSARYAGDSSMALKYMFLAQVATGDFCKGSHDMVAPPEKPQSGDAKRKYDSVVNSKSNPSIFVVFKDMSVYPSYLISFV